jgi:GntR family transcriptional regulator / MocR family aminotransferase
MELAIPLSKNGEPLFRQVYLGLRQAILSATFSAGGRLPSTRDLAEQLGILQTVVVLAYDQLLAEGFVVGRGGSGTYVSEGLGGSVAQKGKRSAKIQLSRFGTAAADAVAAVDSPRRQSTALRYDFAYGRSDVETFPSRCGDESCCDMREWLRFANLTTARRVAASSYAKPSAPICEGLERWSAIRRK